MPIDLTTGHSYHNDRSRTDGTPAQLSAPEAQRMIREIAAESDNIIVVRHGQERAKQRSVTRRQIERCLQKGVIEEGPFLNQHGNWQVTIHRHAGAENLTCAVAIEWPRKLIVITTFK